MQCALYLLYEKSVCPFIQQWKCRFFKIKYCKTNANTGVITTSWKSLSHLPRKMKQIHISTYYFQNIFRYKITMFLHSNHGLRYLLCTIDVIQRIKINFSSALLPLWMSFCSHLMMSAQKKRWFLFIANQSLSHDQEIYHYVYWIPGWSECLQLWKFMAIISNNYEAYLPSKALYF